MAGYVKKIALIKQLKSGFSADGGVSSGLVKAEVYAGFLKVEISLINFAPLSEGRYVFGVTDGNSFITFETEVFESEAAFDLSRGFAAIVCFCHNGVFPVASAVCGDCGWALPALKNAIAEQENFKQEGKESAYDDEAISEVNYYELQTDAGGDPLREDKKEEEKRDLRRENAAVAGVVEKERGVADGTACADGEIAVGGKGKKRPDLAGGNYYERMRGEIERIFNDYPREESLERVIENSRWARIGYGGGKFYAFGVLYDGEEAQYILYGVPSGNAKVPPDSLSGRASYVPVNGGGFWVMYQDARTGVSVKITAE